mgnify:CR=1 FL=1
MFEDKDIFFLFLPGLKASLFDIIDLEAKKCLSGPSGERDIGTLVEDEEAETQEIPQKEEREFDPEEKRDEA